MPFAKHHLREEEANGWSKCWFSNLARGSIFLNCASLVCVEERRILSLQVPSYLPKMRLAEQNATTLFLDTPAADPRNNRKTFVSNPFLCFFLSPLAGGAGLGSIHSRGRLGGRARARGARRGKAAASDQEAGYGSLHAP